MSKLLDASRRKQLQLKAEFLRKARRPVRSGIWTPITWPIDAHPLIQMPSVYLADFRWHIPSGWEAPALGGRTQRTTDLLYGVNYIASSEDLTDASWSGNGIVTATSINDASASFLHGSQSEISLIDTPGDANWRFTTEVKAGTSNIICISTTFFTDGTLTRGRLIIDVTLGVYIIGDQFGNENIADVTISEPGSNGYRTVNFTSQNNDTGNTILRVELYPAWAGVLQKASDVTATGVAYFTKLWVRLDGEVAPYVKTIGVPINAPNPVYVDRAGVWAAENRCYETENLLSADWIAFNGATKGSAITLSFGADPDSAIYQVAQLQAGTACEFSAEFSHPTGATIRLTSSTTGSAREDSPDIPITSMPVRHSLVVKFDVAGDPSNFAIRNQDAGGAQTGIVATKFRIRRLPNAADVYTKNTTALYYGPAFESVNGQLIGVGLEMEQTNYLLHNRDLTQTPPWSNTNNTITKSAVGADGEINSASHVIAAASLPRVGQNTTLVSAAYTFSGDVKRVLGTGVVRVSDNNAVSWTEIQDDINTITYERAFSLMRTQANPNCVYRIDVDTEAIDVDFAQLEDGAFRTSRIPTAASQVTRPERFVNCPDLSAVGLPSTFDGVIEWRGRVYRADSGEIQRLYEVYDDATGANRTFLDIMEDGMARLIVRASGVNIALISTVTPVPSGVDFSAKAQVIDGNYALQIDSDTPVTSAAAGSPTGLTAIRVNSDRAGANVAAQNFAAWSYQPGATLS